MRPIARARGAIRTNTIWRAWPTMEAPTPSGTRTDKAAKRLLVASGMIAGKPVKAIAKAAGCSTRHVERLKAEEETRFVIATVMHPHRDKLRLMAKRAVSAVERAMKAQKKTKADHFTQLRAVERYGDLLDLAAGADREESRRSGQGRHLVTWEDFLIIGRGRTEKT